MIADMDTKNLVVPTPDEIVARIAACEQELKSLRRLLRLAQHLRDAHEARQRREPAVQMDDANRS
jgi:hypothetical protein